MKEKKVLTKGVVLFADTLAISISPMVSKKYQAKSCIDSLFDTVSDSRYLSICVDADALYGSSMNDIIDSLIVELEKYKEGLVE